MIRKCPACEKKNRIPTSHLADTGRCGHCGEAIPAVNAPMEVDTAAFDDIVNNATVPVLVDFWAEWCGPCRMVAPEVKKAAAQLAGEAIVLKVNTERNPDLAIRYNVRGIPNFAVFQNGSVVNQRPGAVGAAQLISYVRSV